MTGSSERPITRWQRVRLNAPPGYPWDDHDVLFEKNMSWLNGLLVGSWLGLFIGALIEVFR